MQLTVEMDVPIARMLMPPTGERAKTSARRYRDAPKSDQDGDGSYFGLGHHGRGVQLRS